MMNGELFNVRFEFIRTQEYSGNLESGVPAVRVQLIFEALSKKYSKIIAFHLGRLDAFKKIKRYLKTWKVIKLIT